MSYTLKPAFWLKTEAGRVEGLVTMQANWSKTYTAASLEELLKAQGMTYTADQCQYIINELVRREVLVSD